MYMNTVHVSVHVIPLNGLVGSLITSQTIDGFGIIDSLQDQLLEPRDTLFFLMIPDSTAIRFS